MKLIRKLRTRIGLIGKMESWAIFECPVCLQKVARHLSNGLKIKSCGSLKCKGNTKHGGKGTRLYKIWDGMKQRILNTNSKDCPNYGGRGIIICDEWLEFIPFRDWSLVNGYSDILVIDRMDNNKGYNPNNCRWVTVLESNRNKRNTITLEIANEIRELYNTNNYTQQELANKYNVTNQTISLIINNKQWKN